MKNSNVVVIGIIAIIIAALSFFGGMKYQQTKLPSFSRGPLQGGMEQNNKTANGVGTRGAKTGTAGAGNNLRMGTISAMDDTSITLKLQDGGSKIIILTATTLYKQTTEAMKTDVRIGDTVFVTGATNSDGSITAENVQINPAMMNTAPNAPKN